MAGGKARHMARYSAGKAGVKQALWVRLLVRYSVMRVLYMREGEA